MHLPWKKKSKVSRISKLVADFQAPKRGGSLVVETGFPTSVVDLFVKNRDRLKKSSRGKSSPPPEEHPDISKSVPVLPPVTATPLPTRLDCVIEGETLRQPNGEVIGGIQAVELLRKDRERPGSCPTGIFASVLKTFVVVVLGLSTKKLAVGITLSAFLLLFLEYIRRRCRLPCFLEPCFDTCVRLQSSLCRGLVRIFQSEGANSKPVVVEEKIVAAVYSGPESKSPVQEIQNIKNDRIEEIRTVDVPPFEDKERACSQSEEDKTGIKEAEEDKGEGALCKVKKKGSARIKSKIIKKIVPKNLRGGKKKKNKGKESEACSEASSYSGDDKCSRTGESEKDSVRDQREQEDEDKTSQSSRCSWDRKDAAVGCLTSAVVCEALEEIAADEGMLGAAGAENAMDEGKARRETNADYLVLFLIVLAGLVGGRMLAFAVTIGWCSILKLINKNRGSVGAPSMNSRVLSST